MSKLPREFVETLEPRQLFSASPVPASQALPLAVAQTVVPLVRIGRTPPPVLVTDKSDYPAFSTVQIRGSGFTPGHTVAVQVLHTDGTSNRGRAYLPRYLVVDRHGSIAENYSLNSVDQGTAMEAVAVQQDRSKMSAVVHFTDSPPDRTPPSTPTNFTAASGGTFSTATLSWTPSTDNTGVTGYKLYRNGALIATLGSSATGYTDTGLFGSTSYNYVLTASDAAGNVSAAAGYTFLTPTNPGGSAPPISGNWNPIFYDDFDTLNTSVWTNGDYYWNGNAGTQATFDPKNVSVNNGVLSLTANNVPETDTKNVLQPYNSGLLQTDGIDGQTAPGFTFTYGYVEIRSKIAPGQGMWSALWMLPASHQDGYELDVFEILGRDPTTYTSFDHAWPTFGASNVDHLPFNTTSDWHTYGVDWEPDHVTWYIDGIAVANYTDTSVIPNQPMYLIMNLDVGGDWAGPLDGTSPATSTWQVDYVKVWQKAP